jgi:hypothetical protein
VIGPVESLCFSSGCDLKEHLYFMFSCDELFDKNTVDEHLLVFFIFNMAANKTGQLNVMAVLI